MQIWQKFEIKIFLLFLGTPGVSKSFTYILAGCKKKSVNDMINFYKLKKI